MSDDLLYLGGVFPVQDDIVPQTTSDTPPGFDLTILLSDSMRQRMPWLSLAKIASQAMYERVEQPRRALEMSRDYNFLSRPLKIALLKMMGLAWNSDVISDAAYDRLLSEISLYNQSHGDANFVDFIGYCLGFTIDMAELWTTDYKTFVAGPQIDSVFDDPPGPWYPTSHVGLLYEQYAADAPNSAQIQALSGIFYAVAPIHLVLKFIGTVVTTTVGPLQMGTNIYVVEQDNIVVSYYPKIELMLGQNIWETEYVLVTINSAPSETVTQQAYAIGWDIDTESIEVTNQYPSDVVVTNGYNVLANSGSSLVLDAPGQTWQSPSGAQSGFLGTQTIVLLQAASQLPCWSNWISSSGVTFTSGVTIEAGGIGYTVAATTAGGYVAGCITASGTDCVMLQFRPNTSTAVKLSRGTDSSTLTISGMTISHTSGVVSSGVFELGSTGFYVFWAVMPGTQVRVYPASSGTGSIDWLDCQIVQGASYPCPVPPRAPTLDSFFAGNLIVPTVGTGPSGFDFSNSAFDVSFSGGDFNYYFLGGEAFETSAAGLLTNSPPQTYIGSSLVANAVDLTAPYGAMVLKVVSLYKEYTTRGLETICTGTDGTRGFSFTVDASYVYMTNLDTSAPVLTAAVPSSGQFNVGVLWTPTSLTFYLNGVSHVCAAPMIPNLGQLWIACALDSPCSATWVNTYLLFMASQTGASNLPNNALMAALTS